MHTHFSLFEGDRNAFADRGNDHGLSEVGRQFIAGVLQHAREITAVTNQWVNSYKRLVVGYEAPVHVSWAYNNRSALVRVPIVRRGKVESTRFEYRAPDPACNPYLAFSVVLAAGLQGIEKGYELGPEAAANLFTMTPEELASEGIRSLPSSLQEALVAMEGSELVAETLGEHVFEWFLRNKRAEWDAYTREVTPYELPAYLPAAVGLHAIRLDFRDGTAARLSRTRPRLGWRAPLERAGLSLASESAIRAAPSATSPRTDTPAPSISALEDPEALLPLCRILRKGDRPLRPLLLVVAAGLPRRAGAARGPLRRLRRLPTRPPRRSRRVSPTCSGAPGAARTATSSSTGPWR